jgi:hypothetical protein
MRPRNGADFHPLPPTQHWTKRDTGALIGSLLGQKFDLRYLRADPARGVSDAVPIPGAAQCDWLAAQLCLGRWVAPGRLAPGGRKLPAGPDGRAAAGPDRAGRTPAVTWRSAASPHDAWRFRGARRLAATGRHPCHRRGPHARACAGTRVSGRRTPAAACAGQVRVGACTTGRTWSIRTA